VIFKEKRVGGRARVTVNEERVLWQGWTEIKWTKRLCTYDKQITLKTYTY